GGPGRAVPPVCRRWRTGKSRKPLTAGTPSPGKLQGGTKPRGLGARRVSRQEHRLKEQKCSPQSPIPCSTAEVCMQPSISRSNNPAQPHAFRQTEEYLPCALLLSLVFQAVSTD